VENSVAIPSKKKKDTELYDPVILLQDTYPKEIKAGTQADICIQQHYS
jgi:hypothetical protein